MIWTNLQTFVAEQHAESTLYLLLDPLAESTNGDPLAIATLQQALGEQAITRVLRPDLAHAPQALPVLVKLSSPACPLESRLLELSARRAKVDGKQSRRYVCGWLNSTKTAEAIAARIVELSHLPAEKGHPYFPLHEPLRLELLVGTFESCEQGYWWPIQQWMFPTSSGANSKVIGLPERGCDPAPHAHTLQQEAKHVAGLLRSWRNALELPQAFTPNRWSGPTPLPPRAAAQVYSQIHQARTLGLQHDHDIDTFALLHLLVHPHLRQHPHVRELIDQAVREQTSLSQLLTPYIDRDWSKVVSDLPHAGARP